MPGPREDALVSQEKGTSQDQFQIDDFPENWEPVQPKAQDLKLVQIWVRGIRKDAKEKHLRRFLFVLDIFIRHGRSGVFRPDCFSTMASYFSSTCQEEFAQLSPENRRRFEEIMDWLRFYPVYPLGQDEDRPTTSGPGGPDEGPTGAGDEPDLWGGEDDEPDPWGGEDDELAPWGSKRPGPPVDPGNPKKQREGTSSRFRIPAALLLR